MILLKTAGSLPSRVILLFGEGLIGSAILRALRSTEEMRAERLPSRWTDPRGFSEDLLAVEQEFRDGRAGDQRPEHTVVWSAGRCRFDARGDETRAELATFSSVLAFAERIASGPAGGRMHVVLIGSAGGLFEGQRVVDRASQPAPHRAYGRLKLEQQRLLLEKAPEIRATVLLPSSVYGFARAGQGGGLVTTLIDNGLRHRVTTISGTSSTLRDFVWADDVGRCAASRILRPPGVTGSPRILASARPASILEIQNMVQETLGRRILVALSPRATNGDDITFAPSVLPADWSASDLRTNIRKISRHALGALSSAA